MAIRLAILALLLIASCGDERGTPYPDKTLCVHGTGSDGACLPRCQGGAIDDGGICQCPGGAAVTATGDCTIAADGGTGDSGSVDSGTADSGTDAGDSGRSPDGGKRDGG